MSGEEGLLLERLCEAESPYDVRDWEDRDGYYVAACRVSIEDVPRLIDVARKWSDPDWPYEENGLDVDPAALDAVETTQADLRPGVYYSARVLAATPDWRSRRPTCSAMRKSTWWHSSRPVRSVPKVRS